MITLAVNYLVVEIKTQAGELSVLQQSVMSAVLASGGREVLVTEARGPHRLVPRLARRIAGWEAASVQGRRPSRQLLDSR
jgi:hypothetical protein